MYGIFQYIFILELNLGIAGASCAYVISIYICSVLLFAHIRFSRKDTPRIGLSFDIISELYHTIQYVVPSILQTFMAVTASNIFPIVLFFLMDHNKNQLAIYTIYILYGLLLMYY